MRLLFILFSFFGALEAKEYPYEISIAAFFKNEMDILPEWIEYHRSIGIEHFWLYNNGSTDNYFDFLKPYIQKGVVELIDWPSPEGGNWSIFQQMAYKDALHRSKTKTKWLAILDIDEFIVPMGGKGQFQEILSSFEKVSDCGGLTLHWLMFGTSRIPTIPEGQLLIETLLYRAEVNFRDNHNVKTICRPDRVLTPTIHICLYKPPYRDYKVDGSHFNKDDILGTQIVAYPLNIHHYWTRSEDYYLKIKCPRRELWEGEPYPQEKIDYYQDHLNREYDDSILPFVREVKNRLGKIL